MKGSPIDIASIRWRISSAVLVVVFMYENICEFLTNGKRKSAGVWFSAYSGSESYGDSLQGTTDQSGAFMQIWHLSLKVDQEGKP